MRAISEPVMYDDSVIVIKQPSEKEVNKLKSDKNFDYTPKAKKKAANEEKVNNYSRPSNHSSNWKWNLDFLGEKGFWYTLLAISVLTILYLLFRNEISGMLLKTPKNIDIFKPNIEEHEDIHVLNFDEMIADAERKLNYRYAIRLHYLNILKNLTDAGLIDWQIDKTNREYEYELRGTRFSSGFNPVTYIFNAAWYGDFPINDQLYYEAKTTFGNYSATIPQVNA